ncbi:RagB/SusD family nutrient uptake outer membrane protein [uncultured Draconibacterium sp.]|uniref:RagB/SusD family nutrient uptake outer membrane protein n=1 Tax=uncultured Draconibacterium sp. TaxID=1573823 RepID=UPI0029C0A56B|nr:RagB/SusD family nutrient uptake outer membrane protein [uncultured Draconibacterium sp.]
MKNKIIALTLIVFTALTACTDLDLAPLSEGSSENWYSNETEIEMAVNDLYRAFSWHSDGDSWTDDWTSRNSLTTITEGNVNGEWGTSRDLWKNSYKNIARANTILANLEESKGKIADDILNRFEAEAKFSRASMYAQLVARFGDVVFYTETMDLEEAFQTGRTDKATVLQTIYADYDFAAQNLPTDWGNDIKRATKGAALGMKARIALYQGDWATARAAAQECMTLGYSLYPSYRDLFLTKTKNPEEVLFSMPRSVELDVALGSAYPIQATIPRNAGGWGAYNPSWDLLASYLCTDGLPIDESPLFNPQEPFENRDPRCNATIVPFQTEHCGYMYQPHPDSMQVLNFTSGKYQFNNDTRSNKQYAAYNALLWKKWVDEDWSDDKKADNDRFILRYADVLLMYAEASIELNQIDDSVLGAINEVRERAYNGSGIDYPAVTTTDQTELRKIVRMERRMEFPWEGLRYMDLVRWRLAEKALTTNIYGMLDVSKKGGVATGPLIDKIVSQGLWFWPETPQIDEDGLPDFTALDNAGFVKILAVRAWDNKQYLWPIPTKEILINDNLSQNDGY